MDAQKDDVSIDKVMYLRFIGIEDPFIIKYGPNFKASIVTRLDPQSNFEPNEVYDAFCRLVSNARISRKDGYYDFELFGGGSDTKLETHQAAEFIAV